MPIHDTTPSRIGAGRKSPGRAAWRGSALLVPAFLAVTGCSSGSTDAREAFQGLPAERPEATRAWHEG
jgi:hypothetical protein